MVFLLHGLPPFPGQSWAQRTWEGGRDGRNMVGTLSIGLKQVCGLPHCPQGTDLSASTTQVETRISSSLLESQGSKLSEKLGLWVFLPDCGPNPFHFLHVCSQGSCQGSSAWP